MSLIQWSERATSATVRRSLGTGRFLRCAVLCVVWSGRAGAEVQDAAPCVPEVQLYGDESLVESVQTYLDLHGVPRTGTPPQCGLMNVYVHPESGKVRVVVSDTAGATDSRLVTDSATASAFVESRLRSDLLLTLPKPTPAEASSAKTAPAKTAPAKTAERGDVASTAEDTPSATAVSSPAPPQPHATDLRVSARFRPGISIASDGSTWGDLAVGGCVELEPICLGVMVRTSLDLGLSGRSAELLTTRSGIDGELTAELPIVLTPTLRLSPGVGLGGGWLRVAPREIIEPPGSEIVAHYGGLRLDAYVRASWSIAPRWTLGLIGYAVADPTAHTGDINDPEIVMAGNPWLRAGAAFELNYGAP